jgi:hypothetical protein
MRSCAAAILEQVGSIVKGLHRNGAIENIGAGRASRWKLASNYPGSRLKDRRLMEGN